MWIDSRISTLNIYLCAFKLACHRDGTVSSFDLKVYGIASCALVDYELLVIQTAHKIKAVKNPALSGIISTVNDVQPIDKLYRRVFYPWAGEPQLFDVILILHGTQPPLSPTKLPPAC